MTRSELAQDRPDSVYKILLKGFAWVLIPGLVLGYLTLFWDPYSTMLGERLCVGTFQIQKLAHNVIDQENSYRFYCLESDDHPRSMTLELFVVSAVLWYLLAAVVWVWMWYGDYFRRRAR